ncbi:MAG: DNA polymerase I [Pirellulaceae bacterium]
MAAKRQQRLSGFEDDSPPAATTETSSAGDPPKRSASVAPREKQAATAFVTPPRDEPVGDEGHDNGDDDLTGKTVYVVDSHSLIYQVFHAMPDMSSPTGQPVGAVHGFTRDMFDLLEKQRPDYLFCAFDHSDETFRHDLYDQYKIKRESMPDDLRPQIGAIQRVLQSLGIPILEAPTYEADDVLATLARQVEERGGRCFLVTGDKDCRQLITDHVAVYNIRKNALMDAAGLADEWGVRPDQVVDFQALVGDSVDNVPGVPLIGPKLARELLGKYDTLENVLAHADEVSGKKRSENLKNFADQARLSRELVKLVDDVPIEIDWRAGRVGQIDMEATRALFAEFGFRRLGDKLDEFASLAQYVEQEPPPEWESDYRTVATLDELQQLVGQMSRQKRISIDTETTSTSPRFAEIVGYSFAWEPGVAYYVPVRAPEGEAVIAPDEALETLRPVLEDPAVEKIGQNLKYDVVVLRSAGCEMRGLAFDTMVADYLIAPGERTHDMDDLARRYLRHETIKISELIGTGKNQKQMDEVPVELVTQYAAEDADVPLRLSGLLASQLAEQQLTELFNDLEMPLVEVLAEMEFNGIKVDVPRLQGLSERFGKRLEELEGEIYMLAGHEFNIDSRQQLGEVLFNELNLPVVKRTSTGPSTDADVLSQLAPRHELPAKIIEYRQNAKLKSTYVDALPLLVHPRTGRVHTSFKQDVAATGRLSSKDPNLQNIPVRTQEGREIRSAFLPGEEGWQLLAADYSQIELRVLAHFCQDAALREAFEQDQDIHARVASEVYGVPLEEVDSDMRRRAKAVNFGVIYGQTPFGLAKALGIDKEEAGQFIDAYFERYPGVVEFIDKVLDESRDKGYVSTISGRRRAIDGVRDQRRRGSNRFRNLPERIAVNTVIQGSAADIIKRAMISLHGRLRREGRRTRMLLQIHDELIFESPPEELTDLAALVRQEMVAAGELSVALKVDLKSGSNWSQCEPWD